VGIEAIDAQDTYRALCEQEASVPLFSQAWWLDAVAPDSWSAVLAYQGDRIVGALPYVISKRAGLTLLTQPQLTQTLGPWIRASNKSYSKALGYEKDVLQALARGLPRFHYYAQNWHWSCQNWLPFYWLGFEQTTRYTYRLDCSNSEKHLWNNLQENIRREIRKAQNRENITVRPAHRLEEFLSLNRMTFERQGKPVPYGQELVERIDEKARSLNARDCLIAVDEHGRQHAGAYIVRSGDTAYYLMGGGNPELRNSGASSLLLWEAIRNQPDCVKEFDFEGSMLEPVERFFRAFGAQQTPYFRVTKAESRALQLAMQLRKTFGTNQ